MVRNIKLVIQYRGTDFVGWQIQNRQKTIQGEITDAICRTTGCHVTLTGAGRTDAGVHALGQVANFRIDHRLEPNRYQDALNYYLSDDIRIMDSTAAEDAFHARHDAVSRRYRYLIGREKSALYRHLRWECPVELEFPLLRAAARLIVGEHDFAPFCVTASRRPNNVCIVYAARWYGVGPLLIFEIRGNRFLHGMVRSLVGAMVNLAAISKDNNPQNLTLQRFGDIIQASTMERVVFTAPPQGLYLVSVQYRKE